MTRYSGFNMLTLGILYETVLRWVVAGEPGAGLCVEDDPAAIRPRAREVGAGRHARQRPGLDDAGGRLVRRLSPERGRLARELDGGRALRQRGDVDLRLACATRSAGPGAATAALQPMPIPDALRGGWQVEADFIAAIRGERPVTHTDFRTGVRYMQFTEAVARSSRHQVPGDPAAPRVLQPEPLNPAHALVLKEIGGEFLGYGGRLRTTPSTWGMV